MAVPKFDELTLPLLELASDGLIHRMKEARDNLAGSLGLTDAERAEKLPSGKQNRFANRVAWAKVYLQKAAILESPKSGEFRITDRGREILKNPPERITVSFPRKLLCGTKWIGSSSGAVGKAFAFRFIP